MNKYEERIIKLRSDKDKVYNCAQALLVAYSDVLNMDEETAYHLASNFGGGMKMAKTCGAITGGLMILGLKGIDNPKIINSYYKSFKDNHNQLMDCKDLLKVARENNIEKKLHCDCMIKEASSYVLKILQDEGKI